MRTPHRSIATITCAALVVLGLGAANTAAAAVPAAAAPVAGIGRGTATRVDVAKLPPASADSLQAKAVPAQRRGTAALPVRASSGTKPAAVNARAARGGPNTLTSARARGPLVAPAVVANFDGLNQATGCGGCQPPDPNAAVGTTQILNAVNVAIRATSKTGATSCTFSLASFLGTSDSLSDPRVQYDNVNNRFSFTVTIVPASGATPAIWVAASTSNNACGSWFRYRVTFSGGSFPAGELLDYPILGQDRNALLFGTDNFGPSRNATVFAIPKSAVYSGAGFSFSAFNTASLSAPVSNGGIPMISTGFSYFLASVPGTGYRLYRLTNSGGAGATLTLQATISSAFNAPSRRVNQPGTTATLDPLDGRIAWSPVNDGSFIWFAHGINISGFPGVRYGAISIAGNTATVALAYRSGTSDDFNPSVGVGNAPGGGNNIFVNWAYTDSANNRAVSDTVDSVAPGAGVPNLIGTGTVLVNGAITSQSRFGDYSSVAIDPSVSAGSCAVTAQQYFASGGSWRTRIARVGRC